MTDGSPSRTSVSGPRCDRAATDRPSNIECREETCTDGELADSGSVSKSTLRVAFFGWALVVSPLLVWLFRETIYEADATTGWIWMIGVPALITIVAGQLIHGVLWELVLGAALSAAVAVASLLMTIVVACQGMSDCL